MQDGIGFLLLGITETERLIPTHLTMLDKKECCSSYLSSGAEGSHSAPTKTLSYMSNISNEFMKIKLMNEWIKVINFMNKIL